MFTVYHLIWGIISLFIIVLGLVLLNKYKPELNKVLSVSCALSVISEIVKTLSVMQMVPSSDGAMNYPYIEMINMPLHLCSIQIFLMFYVRFTKNEKMRQIFLGFMYPSCSIGAFFALLLPSIFNPPESYLPADAFVIPHVYQFFLYHCMLVILGLYIPLSGQVKLKPKNYLYTVEILLIMAFASFYVNSALATATYENGNLINVDYMPNLFFTFVPPIDIKLTEVWHWYIYIVVLLALALTLIALFYLPVFIKAVKEGKEKPEKVLVEV